jgi:hypothetical protein
MTGINGMPPTAKNFSRARAYAVNYMPIMPVMPPYPPKNSILNILGFFWNKNNRQRIKKYSGVTLSWMLARGRGLFFGAILRVGRRLEKYSR